MKYSEKFQGVKSKLEIFQFMSNYLFEKGNNDFPSPQNSLDNQIHSKEGFLVQDPTQNSFSNEIDFDN